MNERYCTRSACAKRCVPSQKCVVPRVVSKLKDNESLTVLVDDRAYLAAQHHHSRVLTPHLYASSVGRAGRGLLYGTAGAVERRAHIMPLSSILIRRFAQPY